MRKSYLNLFRVGFLTLNLLLLPFAVNSQKTLPEPLRQCWEFTTDEINKTEIASDNASHIYFSSKDGHIIAVNLADGSPEWKTELGGRTEKILYDKETLYVTSINTQDRAKKITVRAISAGTGIAKWQRDLETEPDNQAGENSVVSDEDYIFLITAAGNLYKLSKNEGQQLERATLGATATTAAEISDKNIYVGTDQKSINIYSTVDKTLEKVQLDEVPTTIYTAENRVIIGDRLGRLIALNFKGEKEWQTRTGAEITNIAKTDRGIAVSSNDNFIYLVSLKNGEKLWKKRLTGRTTAISSEADRALLVVNLNGDLSTLVEIEQGKTINQVTVQSPRYFVNKPILLNDIIVFHTSTGLIAYTNSAGNCLKEKKTGD